MKLFYRLISRWLVKAPKERQAIIHCKLDGVDYAFGVNFDDFKDDPNRLEGAIRALSNFLIITIMKKTDILDECDFIMKRKNPDNYFKMMEERKRKFM